MAMKLMWSKLDTKGRFSRLISPLKLANVIRGKELRGRTPRGNERRDGVKCLTWPSGSEAGGHVNTVIKRLWSTLILLLIWS